MRFLLDMQLPPSLAARLRSAGFDAVHADELGMSRASDGAIWQRAIADEAVLVSKDADFITIASKVPNGPQLVWVRTGNTSNQAIWAAFERSLPQIIESLKSGDRIVMVR